MFAFLEVLVYKMQTIDGNSKSAVKLIDRLAKKEKKKNKKLDD